MAKIKGMTIDRESDLADIWRALVDCEEYFDQRADADCLGDPPSFVPNQEMRLQMNVKAAIDQLETMMSSQFGVGA